MTMWLIKEGVFQIPLSLIVDPKDGTKINQINKFVTSNF